jgi:hypothetical protein
MPISALVPPIVLLLCAIGILSGAWLAWSAIVYVASVGYWALLYLWFGQPLWYALLYPLGLGALLYIAAGAVARGSRVAWKGRDYTSA